VPDPLDFTGAVVLVTGGTKGVGRGIAKRFGESGATVVTCARSAPAQEVAPEVAREQQEIGPRHVEFIACDVRDPDLVEQMVASVVARHGRLDVVVNNAGGAPPADSAIASPRFSDAVIRLNLLGALYVAQAANRVMQGQDSGGSIVNIASVSALRASPNTAAYGAAKAGVISLTASLAVEWGPKVRVNAVALGLIRTEKSHLYYGDEQGIARVAATVPLGRMGTPEDAGDVCLFLASPLASYVSGATLLVHGGGERPAYIDAAADERRDA
jgi:NAD(P)-dependent dehydrogenase (short-subunit alcohol dehydrogenase family)